MSKKNRIVVKLGARISKSRLRSISKQTLRKKADSA